MTNSRRSLYRARSRLVELIKSWVDFRSCAREFTVEANRATVETAG
jgi:hypothetical protein